MRYDINRLIMINPDIEDEAVITWLLKNPRAYQFKIVETNFEAQLVWVKDFTFALQMKDITPVPYSEPSEYNMKKLVDALISSGTISKFSSSADSDAHIWNWWEAKMLYKLSNGFPLEASEYYRLTQKIANNTYYVTSIPSMGWRFGFRDYLTRYVVKPIEDDRDCFEYWGFSEDTLMLALFPDGWDYCVEVPNNELY